MKTAITLTLPNAANNLLSPNASSKISKLIIEANGDEVKNHLSTRRTSCTLTASAARKLIELELDIKEPAPTIIRAIVEIALTRENFNSP